MLSVKLRNEYNATVAITINTLYTICIGAVRTLQHSVFVEPHAISSASAVFRDRRPCLVLPPSTSSLCVCHANTHSISRVRAIHNSSLAGSHAYTHTCGTPSAFCRTRIVLACVRPSGHVAHARDKVCTRIGARCDVVERIWLIVLSANKPAERIMSLSRAAKWMLIGAAVLVVVVGTSVGVALWVYFAHRNRYVCQLHRGQLVRVLRTPGKCSIYICIIINLPVSVSVCVNFNWKHHLNALAQQLASAVCACAIE